MCLSVYGIASRPSRNLEWSVYSINYKFHTVKNAHRFRYIYIESITNWACNLSFVCVCVDREELTYEMLVLEPRASDDETPESEASIGTADSSENLTMQGATSDPSGACVCLCLCVYMCYSGLILCGNVAEAV